MKRREFMALVGGAIPRRTGATGRIASRPALAECAVVHTVSLSSILISLAEQEPRYIWFLRRAATCIGYRYIRGTAPAASKLEGIPDTDYIRPSGRSEFDPTFRARG